jgi:magnesium transporter
MLDNSENVYVETVDDRLTTFSTEMNSMMNIFAGIATIFLPCQLISSLWGMNVSVPFNDEDNYLPFIGITIATLII